MSELYYSPEAAAVAGFRKWGFEFTMRLKPFADHESAENPVASPAEHEPLWALNLMQFLARYVNETGSFFVHVDFAPVNGPLRDQSGTKLVGVAFVPDLQLQSQETVHSKLEFLQIV